MLSKSEVYRKIYADARELVNNPTPEFNRFHDFNRRYVQDYINRNNIIIRTAEGWRYALSQMYKEANNDFINSIISSARQLDDTVISLTDNVESLRGMRYSPVIQIFKTITTVDTVIDSLVTTLTYIMAEDDIIKHVFKDVPDFDTLAGSLLEDLLAIKQPSTDKVEYAIAQSMHKSRVIAEYNHNIKKIEKLTARQKELKRELDTF